MPPAASSQQERATGAHRRRGQERGWAWRSRSSSARACPGSCARRRCSPVVAPTPRTSSRTCSRPWCSSGARSGRPTTSTPTCGGCSSTRWISRCRKASSKELVDHDVVVSGTRAPSHPDPARQVVDGQVLWDAVCGLPPRQRAAVVLRFYEDLPDVRAAEALGCSTGAFRVLVHRGVAALREQTGLHDALDPADPPGPPDRTATDHRRPATTLSLGGAAMTTDLRTRDPGPELPGLVETLELAADQPFDLGAVLAGDRRPRGRAAPPAPAAARRRGLGRRGRRRGCHHVAARPRSRPRPGGHPHAAPDGGTGPDGGGRADVRPRRPRPPRPRWPTRSRSRSS